MEDHLNVRFSCNDQTFFEILKMKIRSISITYSIKKSREEKSLYRTLENDIQNLENIMNSSPDDVTQASLEHKKIELGNKRQQKIEGLLLRSRANWHENGEKCSEYLCKLEKKNFIKKTITELIDENGQHITDPSEILLEQQNFL